MLASLGRSFVLVHQRPLVAIVATGDELVEIDEAPSEGKIVSSNSYALAALVRECGAVPLQIGIARDSREDLIAKFRAAMRADLIVSSGGVSVGDYDLVKEIMKEAGNRMQFWQVAMKPGRPLAFGALGDVPAIGLPGNPVSSMICFEQFIRPAILKMLGHANLFRRTVRARLERAIRKKKGIRQFIRALIRREGDGYAVVTTGDEGSGILKSMVQCQRPHHPAGRDHRGRTWRIGRGPTPRRIAGEDADPWTLNGSSPRTVAFPAYRLSFPSMTCIASPGLIVPSRITMAKMPSRGMTQSPTILRISHAI